MSLAAVVAATAPRRALTTARSPRRRVLAPMALAMLAACCGHSLARDGAAPDERVAVRVKVPDQFKHPGIFATQARLDTFKAAANSANASVMKTGYGALTADSRSSYDYQQHALVDVEVVGSAIGPEEARYKNDAMAAYLNALRWVKTGNHQHRDRSMMILNDWARTFRSFSVAKGTDSAQTQLEAAWMLPVWVSAAEIIRRYNNGEAGWSPADISTFNSFVNRQYSYAEKARTRVNNWAVSASLAMMAAGVYQDNKSRYAAGLRRLTEMIPLSVFASGEVNELRDRDCTHPQYNLEGLSQGAEMATIQGDTSIWLYQPPGETKPRLAKGLEYMANSLRLGQGVRDCRSATMEAGYMDIAVNGYMNRGVPIPNFQTLSKERRPDRGSMQFLGWTTATHGRDDY